MTNDVDSLNVYSVYDIKADNFGTPFFAMNNSVAIRSFAGAVNDVNTLFNKWPEDFHLYLIGQFDIKTASLSSVEKYKVVSASEVLVVEGPMSASSNLVE